jgi:hypothetical protein
VERDERLRAAGRVTFATQIDRKRLVFVYEMGINTSRSRCWAPCRLKGKVLTSLVPRNRGPNTTLLLSSMTTEGMGSVPGGGGSYHRGGLRDFRGERVLSHPCCTLGR